MIENINRKNVDRSIEMFIWIVMYFLCDNVFSNQIAALGNILRYIVLAVWFLKSTSRGRIIIDKKYIIPFVFAVIPSLMATSYTFDCIIKISTMLFMMITVSNIFQNEVYSLEDLYYGLTMWAILYTLLSAVLISSPLGYHNTGAFHGLSGNRNPFGTAMVIANTLFLDNFRHKYKMKKVFYGILFLTSVYFIIISQSKGALLGVTVTWVLYLFINSKYKRQAVLILFGVLILIMLLYPYLLKIPVFMRVFNEGVTRGDLWEYGLIEFKKYPIFGAGFGVSYMNNVYDTVLGMAYNYHNAYLSILTDVGIWGALCFICMFAYLFNSILLSLRINGNNRNQTLFIIILGFFAQSWGESFLLAAGNPLCLVCWMCMFAIIAERYT